MEFHSRKRGKRIRLKPRFFVIIGVFIILAALLLFKVFGALSGGTADKSEKKAEPKKETRGTIELSITVAGDNVIHEPVFSAAKTGKGYDFKPPFRYVKSYIEEADAAICTYEGSLVDSNFTGYPSFRTPKALAKDMYDLGFDAMSITSNHALDGGDDGFSSTVETTKKAGLAPSGGQLSPEDPDYALVENDNKKVAFISYSYSDGTPDAPALNGAPVMGDMKEKINTFNDKDKKGAVANAAKAEKAARKAGADVVVLIMHWGVEYENAANDNQKKLAQMLVDGTTCDIIVGSHPHVVQQFSLLKSKDGEREVPCFFAIGNLLSNQRRDLVYGNPHVEEGMLALFKVKYNDDEKKVENIEIGHVPYWVNKYYDGKTDKEVYAIVPLTKGYENNETLVEAGTVGLAKTAAGNLQKILGKDLINLEKAEEREKNKKEEKEQ